MEITEHYARIFVGCDYEIDRPATVGALTKQLEEIIADLKEIDQREKIAEFYCKNTTLYYILEEGIPQ